MSFFQNIYTFFYSIFFDDSGQKDFGIETRIYTNEYKKQIKNMHLDEVIVACEYREVEGVVKSYKYQGQQYKGRKIAEIYSEVIIDFFKHTTSKHKILVSVPTHWARRLYRGFDHIKYITKQISKQTKIPYFSLLSVRKYTPQQSKLSRKRRLKNKIQAFKIQSRSTIPNEVILIDDIISTGSTANECAKILKQNGAKKVYGFFLATNQ